MSLGSVGTRRTVYLAEEESPANKPQPTAPPLLVYNRISTVIGEPQQREAAPQEETPQDNNERKVREGRKDNEIWYEYGCV